MKRELGRHADRQVDIQTNTVCVCVRARVCVCVCVELCGVCRGGRTNIVATSKRVNVTGTGGLTCFLL
jgi:hypothetical protein